MNIAVLYGSTRENRQGIKVAKFITKQLEERGHKAVLVDQKEYNLPFLDKMHKNYEEGEAPENIEQIHQLLETADGFVVINGEYNHSIQPGLKNLLDHYQREFYFKPAGIVSYSGGAFGGVRAAPHLRIILGELGMATISTMFAVSKIRESIDEAGNAIDESYNRRVAKFLDELEWHTKALKSARKEGTPF